MENLVCGFASAYYRWLDVEQHEEFNSSGIVFIAKSMQKLLTRVVWPTELKWMIATPSSHTEDAIS